MNKTLDPARDALMREIEVVGEVARSVISAVAPDLAPNTAAGYDGWKWAAGEVMRRRIDLVTRQGHCKGAAGFDWAYAAASAVGNLIGEVMGTPAQKAWAGTGNLAQAREVLGLN